MNNITEVDLKTFLAAKRHIVDNYISMTLDNVNKVMILTKVMKEKNKYGALMEYRLRTVIPVSIWYHDYDHETEVSLNLEKKDTVDFFLDFDKSENILFALEFYRRLKGAKLTIGYYAFNNSQNEIERGFSSEMIEIRIETNKETHRMYIKHHYVYFSCAMRREY